jgi:ribA/ribD-fused uncharacterized protein
MMAEKARLFGDVEFETRILQSDCPREHKKLGKQVAGFSEERCAAQRQGIVFRGNAAKFSQNPELKRVLLETGDRCLVKASPIDKVWGIGLAANSPLTYDSDSWRGLNLLGKVLEDVWRHLRER